MQDPLTDPNIKEVRLTELPPTAMTFEDFITHPKLYNAWVDADGLELYVRKPSYPEHGDIEIANFSGHIENQLPEFLDTWEPQLQLYFEGIPSDSSIHRLLQQRGYRVVQWFKTTLNLIGPKPPAWPDRKD